MNSSNGNFLDENGNPVNIVQLLKTGKAVPVENPGPGLHMAAHSGWFTDESGKPVNIIALIDAAIDEDGGDDEPPIGGISINGGNVVTPDENGIINLTISGDGSTVIDSKLSASSTNPVQNKVVTGEIEELSEAVDLLNGSLDDVQSTIDSIIKSNPPIEKYLYKEDTYITISGVETTLLGYDTYKIPVSSGDMVLIKQTHGETAFYDGINNDVVYHILNNDSYERVYAAGAGTHPNYYFYPNSALFRSQFKLLANENVTAVLITVKHGNTGMVSVQHNDAVMVLSDTGKIDYRNTIVTLDDNNTLASNIYKMTTNMLKLADGYTVRTYHVLSGEKVVIPAKATGINYYGFFINSSTLEISQITDAVFTVQADGFVETFAYSSDNIVITVYPAKSISIDYSAIKNIPVSENPFTGLSAVAFGTSITYRGQEGRSGGYLQYLPGLSGMTFDNQGIGNSTILGNMLTAIKAYTGYADKNVCTLEGFVNDWIQGKTLGTYTDETEDTVCGCVRSAINYILSQNKNMTMFLILDHYGRVYGTTDCSSTAKNSNNQTQYQYYEEIAKVAESLAIPVIKLYAVSQISENTGLNMYLADNIHPTALGARQDAYTIWAKMRTYFPNQQLS